MTFLDDFDRFYAHKLSHRQQSFRLLFSLMEEKAARGESLNIIETGCLRIANNWEGDGQSSYLFSKFVEKYPSCKLDIYDISPESISVCEKQIVPHGNIRLHCQDSVRGLWDYLDKVDVMYLDSFDVNFDHAHPSAFHHIKELCALMKNVTHGTLVMVDDNMNGVGKGQYVHEFMDNIGAETLFDGYQILFRFKPSIFCVGSVNQ